MRVLFKKILPRAKKQKILSLLIISVLSITGVTLFFALRNNTTKEEPVITYSTDQPDESKTNADNYDWRGAPDEPKKIRINKIGVDAYVQKSGVDQNNKMAVPNNVHLTSWYAGKDANKPGMPGYSVIAGHVTGKKTDGIFKQLKQLQKDDEFEVELGNGDIKRYKVLESVTVKESESAGILFSQNPKVKSQVNLVTCGGDFDERANQYADRIIVSGELI